MLVAAVRDFARSEASRRGGESTGEGGRPSWGSLGGLLGHLGAVLGASWPFLERREAEKARTRKSFNNLTNINAC